jgi:hypothetical protein
MKDLKFRDLVEFLVLPLLSAAVWVLFQMNANINQLNIQVGVIIAEGSIQKEQMKELSSRVLELEKRR